MRGSNLAAQNQRQAETGLVWELKVSNASTTIQVAKQSSLRISAVADCIVTLDGVQSVWIKAGEVALINAGKGIDNASNAEYKVKVEFSAAVYCSVALP